MSSFIRKATLSTLAPVIRAAAVSALPVALALPLAVGQAMPARAEVTQDSFTAASLSAALLRIGVSYARWLVDVRYGALEVDNHRGAVILRDLEVQGRGDFSECRVTLGKLDLSGISFLGSENMHGRLEATDLAIATNCFGPNAAMIGMVTGAPVIPVTSLVIDSRNQMGPGAVAMDVELVSNGIGRIEGSADFDYMTLWAPALLDEIVRGGPRGYTPPSFDESGNLIPSGSGQPVPLALRGELRAAHLTVQDLGLWQRLKPIMPPDATDPAMADMVITAEPGSAERAVQESLAAALRNFMTDPGQITVELRPETPLSFDTADWTAPEEALAVLNPVFSNAPATPPVALIAAPGGGDPLALGMAFADGIGLPQNTRRALDLLAPLQDDPQAMLTVARLSIDSDLPAAYGAAQRAALLGGLGAPALLDRIEGRMSTAALLGAQAAADIPPGDDVFASVTALRNAAIAAAEGNGVARSYVLARRLAGSAAAAGDGQAASLIARLETRFADDADWIAARDRAAEQALEDWTGRDLAARFSAR
ncbi:MAG: hypothetical protein Q4G26_05145 [Paracoccus sp. (in: a-proteobacteria)]|nr:hypothetical protein [Paracoccus sp. (in: a-proteobacteria)]